LNIGSKFTTFAEQVIDCTHNYSTIKPLSDRYYIYRCCIHVQKLLIYSLE